MKSDEISGCTGHSEVCVLYGVKVIRKQGEVMFAWRDRDRLQK